MHCKGCKMGNMSLVEVYEDMNKSYFSRRNLKIEIQNIKHIAFWHETRPERTCSK